MPAGGDRALKRDVSRQHAATQMQVSATSTIPQIGSVDTSLLCWDTKADALAIPS